MRLLKLLAVIAAVLVVGVLLLTDQLPAEDGQVGPTPGASATTPSGTTISATLADAVDLIVREPEDRTPYKRIYFGDGWQKLPGECRNTRQHVLARDSSVPVGDTCRVHRGRWHSWYDDRTWTESHQVQIDHLVPLAEAWDSGAHLWDKSTRVAYANDLGDPRTLVVTTGEVNDDKGSDDPTWWIAPADPCRYVADWVAVKLRWGMSADTRELNAIKAVVPTCPADTRITVERAR